MNTSPHLAAGHGTSSTSGRAPRVWASKPGNAYAELQRQAEGARDILAQRWDACQSADASAKARRVHYLSMEFLMGRALRNALDALGQTSAFESACTAHGLDAAEVLEREHDAALGNGGLGRLAACFLDAMAELGLPSFGYGLRYEYGMFAQAIQDGRQTEMPDDWLRDGNPWEFVRPQLRYRVGFGGHVSANAFAGASSRHWVADETVVATAYDFVVPAHASGRVATLRQWRASSESPLDFARFSRGEHAAAVNQRVQAERLTWVLYPDDSTPAGRELRLRQEYFLVSATLQDILARHIQENGSLDNLSQKVVVHLNDTHPALTVPELIRLLVDEHGMDWDRACAECLKVVSYTNHTLMPEALETWPLDLMARVLPRHLEIIYEVNARFLADVRRRFPGDEALTDRLSLIEEQGERRVRMANLSIVMSHAVNGVSALHSQLMVDTIFADFARVFPGRFCNVTNGVTPRRWLIQCNPALSHVLDGAIGTGWRRDASELRKLQPTPEVVEAVHAAKQTNKRRVAELLQRELGLHMTPNSLLDVQIKRIHEYKRQLLNVMQVVARYQAICENPEASWVPRTVVFAGKAASAYVAAKSVIHLIHDVARVVNGDPRVDGRLKVAFLPNYGVSLAEVLIPGADLSEQISTAGTEASGTGNMKFALNGALTIGTWDGANIEMAEQIGSDQLFIFGLHADAVVRMKEVGYDPRLLAEQNPRLKSVIDAIRGGQFSPGEAQRYHALMDSLLHHDTFMLLADFGSYMEAQARVDDLYVQPRAWGERAVRNIAGMGYFSADRTVAEYAGQIWSLPLAVNARAC